MLCSKQSAQHSLCARRTFAAAPVSRRALVVVANEKQGKGGEEGGAKFDNSVYGTVAKNANFMLLGASIAKCGLDKALSGETGPWTVFAPNDDAFSATAKALKLSKMELLALPNLADILKYHVVSGKVMSADLKGGQEVTTLLGKTFKVSLAGGAKVNGIKIKKADVKVANGVLHVLEGVLIPE
eukprot:CAMPEP_0119105928 /NCGR_PEP_ID=MMETSP1180-20130426/3755_1 /TAXON_ID=3052 ORGANISM="Chlamydomonas cf sp, Strain CCMP681" /NCGR_SAMPLE_ID=MMETSP1180 /ASSEMBLY_ACC=CAM_ASM_000741 /LENGTH=183 /DNA_ID=CAMNT_0007091109 /DNA_START=81 /DNA_END=632 /DNA_ORIENTATION=-